MTHDVFISYPGHDKNVADAICATLESRKIRCWIAPRDIRPGTPYSKALINAIDASCLFILVFSSNTNESPHIEREISRAVNKGLIIIPFRIEEVEPSDGMQYYIGTPHWLDAITRPLEEHLLRLAETVEIFLKEKKNQELKKQPLIADFTADPKSGPAPLTVYFNDLSSGNPKKWNWILGDGTFSEIQNPVHSYSKPGEYGVELSVGNETDHQKKVFNSFIHVKGPLSLSKMEMGELMGAIPGTNTKEVNILVVDDDEFSSDIINITLQKKFGFNNIATSENASAAFIQVMENRPDVIIMDIGLSGSFINGVQAAAIMFNIFCIPVLFISAYSDAATRVGELKNFGVFLKPLTVKQFNDKLVPGLLEAVRWTRNLDFFETEEELMIGPDKVFSISNGENPIFILDNEGQIIFINQSEEILSGVSASSAFLRHFLTLFTIRDNNGLEKSESFKLVPGIYESLDIGFPNGLKKTVTISVKQIKSPLHEYSGYYIELFPINSTN